MAVIAVALGLIVVLAVFGYFWVRKTAALPDTSLKISEPVGPKATVVPQGIVSPQPASSSKRAAAAKRTLTGSSLHKHAPRLLPEQFVVLDLETTGYSCHLDEILEIGAIRAGQDSGSSAEFHALVKTEKRIPRLIADTTGITQAMADRDGVPLAAALADFTEFIGDLPLVTYNAAFDMGFLQTAARLQGYVFKNHYTCAMTLARRAWPTLPSHKLEDLARSRNLPLDDAHRAVGDSRRALIIFLAAVEQVGKVRWTTPSLEPAVEETRERSPRYEQMLQVEKDVIREGNPEGPLHGEVVVITGECSMSRAEIADYAARAGCDVRKGITKHTTILVTGIRDASLYGGKKKSGKLEDAEAKINNGQCLRILTETDFMRILTVDF